MLKQVNAMGDTCPLPVVKTKKAIAELNGGGTVEVLVANEIAVQNLTKMANQKGYGIKSEKLGEAQFRVVMEVGEVTTEEVSVDVDEACLLPGVALQCEAVMTIMKEIEKQ